MSRKRPSPQDASTQLNASVPWIVKEKLTEEAQLAGYKSVSAFLTQILKERFGMV